MLGWNNQKGAIIVKVEQLGRGAIVVGVEN
jgi:hypothetical protein